MVLAYAGKYLNITVQSTLESHLFCNLNLLWKKAIKNLVQIAGGHCDGLQLASNKGRFIFQELFIEIQQFFSYPLKF